MSKEGTVIISVYAVCYISMTEVIQIYNSRLLEVMQNLMYKMVAQLLAHAWKS